MTTHKIICDKDDIVLKYYDDYDEYWAPADVKHHNALNTRL